MNSLEKTLKWTITGSEKMTGLPEYRNGGLLIDFEYIRPKPLAFIKSLGLEGTDASGFSLMGSLPALAASHGAIVEWRALTVIALDRILSRSSAMAPSFDSHSFCVDFFCGLKISPYALLY